MDDVGLFILFAAGIMVTGVIVYSIWGISPKESKESKVYTEWENVKFGVDTAATAKNLSKLGYQKIVWHDVKKELPELNKYVLSYDYYNQTYMVVSWDGTDWSDNIGVYYNVDYWAELPKINLE